MHDDLDDEDYGRRWAAMVRVWPVPLGGLLMGFVDASLPDELSAVRNGVFMNEGHAYTALGAAVRAVHAAVPQLGARP